MSTAKIVACIAALAAVAGGAWLGRNYYRRSIQASTPLRAPNSASQQYASVVEAAAAVEGLGPFEPGDLFGYTSCEDPVIVERALRIVDQLDTDIRRYRKPTELQPNQAKLVWWMARMLGGYEMELTTSFVHLRNDNPEGFYKALCKYLAISHLPPLLKAKLDGVIIHFCANPDNITIRAHTERLAQYWYNRRIKGNHDMLMLTLGDLRRYIKGDPEAGPEVLRSWLVLAEVVPPTYPVLAWCNSNVPVAVMEQLTTYMGDLGGVVEYCYEPLENGRLTEFSQLVSKHGKYDLNLIEKEMLQDIWEHTINGVARNPN